jgi:phospholipid transport system substrate-binding protein
MTFRRWIALIAVTSLLSIASAHAAAESPTLTLKKIHTRLNKLLAEKIKKGTPSAKKNQEEITKTVNTLLDFPELAKLSLGKHWEARSTQEKEDFIQLLKDLIERNYVKQLRTNLSYQLDYKAEEVESASALVQTSVKVKKDNRTTEILIDYKLRKTEQGWMVFDIITDEVSLIKNYRSQFNRIIRKESYEALVKKMKRKLEEDDGSVDTKKL